MPANVQVSQCDATTCVQGFSCQKREAHDHDIILVTSKSSAYIDGGEYIRGSAHELKAIVWVFGSHTFWKLTEKPLTLCCSYFGAPHVESTSLKESVFICSTACAQGHLGYPWLV